MKHIHRDGLSDKELMVTEESEHTWWLSCIFEGLMHEAMCAHSLSVTLFFSLTSLTMFCILSDMLYFYFDVLDSAPFLGYKNMN